MTLRLATLLLLLAIPARAEPGTVAVTVTNVRSDAGHVLVALCDRATFLRETCRYHGRARAAAGSVTVRLGGVPPGTYALQAYQDENDNGKIDRTLLGLPREGMGFSNGARMRFGPPSFDDAAVAIGPNGGALELRLTYYD